MRLRASFRLLALTAFFAAPLLAAASAEAAETCALKPLAAVDMHEYPSGRMGLPMTLNGRPSQLLLDTGGGIRALSGRVVQELGLKTTQGGVVMLNVQGHGSSAQVRVPNVEFAGAKFPEVTFSVMAGSMVDKDAAAAREAAMTDEEKEQQKQEAIDGLFTPDLFYNKADYDIDFANKRFTLFSNDHCKGQVVYWPAQAVAAVPFYLTHGNHIQVDVQLDGKDVRAILDTGADVTTLDLKTAQYGYGIDLDGKDVEKLDELTPGKATYRKRFKTLSFEGIGVANPLVTLLPDAMPKEEVTGSHIHESVVNVPTMLIGMSILKKLHIYIAFRERMLYITPGAVNAPDKK